MKTKIIYLNTQCNLRCTYCYEKHEFDKVTQDTLSKDRIDQLIDEIQTESKDISCIVIFGGEPFIAYKQLFYLLEQLIEKDLKHIPVNMSTNGTILALKDNILLEFLALAREFDTFSLEVSYDGIYHDETRIFPNGKGSKYLVEKALQLLIKHDFPFRIRYSLHRKAVENLNDTAKDLIRIILTYKPERIILNRVYSDFPSKDVFSHNETLIKYLNSIYKHLKVPLCDFVCDSCKLCHPVDQYEYVGEKQSSIIQPGYKNRFDDFTKLF